MDNRQCVYLKYSCARIYHIYIQEHLERANHVEPIIINNLLLRIFFFGMLLLCITSSYMEVVIYISGSTFYLTSARKQLSFPFLLTTCFPLFSIVVLLVLFEELLHFFQFLLRHFNKCSSSFFFIYFFFTFTQLCWLLPNRPKSQYYTKCVHRIVWYLGGKINVYLSCMHNVFC